ncbi:hypothetical protein [Candidatus Amarolinea dominans]|uniref:hypothetical protein n=1 Tax=Candidatus Amarolinea dominans TaxID=3140696 RepID=UPI0031350707|nr:hypothetical protein [Anaerolineae bacterium]
MGDLLAAAAPGSLAAALLTNAGVLLRLLELHYAGAANRAAASLCGGPGARH